MLIYNTDSTVTFSLFKNYSRLVCFLTTRILGDMRKIIDTVSLPPIINLFNQYHIHEAQLVNMNQIHDKVVFNVKKEHHQTVVKNTDGLVTDVTDRYLVVRSADCVPIFFYEPEANIIAVCHSGWRGTLKKISLRVVDKMIELGGLKTRILAAIGPHIGACCYDVDFGRAQAFLNEFKTPNIAYAKDGKWYVDLGKSNYLLLKHYGIMEKNIDAPITCTSCQNKSFFSFRKNRKESYGEILGVIGMRN